MKEKGLTGFQLKLIGLFLMIFDHIHEMFGFKNNIPVAFNWVGRIVAPIFIFMTVQGFIHTRNRRKYAARLYIGSVLMNLGNFIIPKYFQRTDDLALFNNIFATLFMIVIYLSIIEYLGKSIKEKNTLGIVKGIGLLILPIAIGFIIIMNIAAPGMMYAVFIIPTPLFVEGGPVFILLGIMMYLFREKKKMLVIVYSILSIIIMLMGGDITIQGLLFKNYQWMMIFAAPLFYLYNGQKGKGVKYLFYVFYPAHIYIFYIISVYMMKK
ncbi:conjugal transfer protein TraX [Clostridium botulinum]|uniref:TraX family protein n=1 Tax=Clostridium botulinum TaxID=1491 RepID=UPI0013F89EA7|nr:TraX family protein [Clostridium botulinum]MBN3407888.1 conjugal transfer protein TraX [Clostridium botulinum]MBY6872573.1 conjugal transfer protein TraX [Clostridium botulinum]MBY6886553.1 conjugal transfer protein TraX [Clostridium botulinum]NFI44958.1 conjugal transfer protein TraX [Clostridium botulinum]NFJ90382.1 conjugal transfer protein TraX [Clostridium botulinum]